MLRQPRPGPITLLLTGGLARTISIAGLRRLPETGISTVPLMSEHCRGRSQFQLGRLVLWFTKTRIQRHCHRAEVANVPASTLPGWQRREPIANGVRQSTGTGRCARLPTNELKFDL